MTAAELQSADHHGVEVQAEAEGADGPDGLKRRRSSNPVDGKHRRPKARCGEPAGRQDP